MILKLITDEKITEYNDCANSWYGQVGYMSFSSGSYYSSVAEFLANQDGYTYYNYLVGKEYNK